jgi:endonuclease/exonuclease/phosphatase family metal-dependent hydrolase
MHACCSVQNYEKIPTDRDKPLVRFKVLTYNIHRAIGVDRRFRLDRIIKILAHHQADIVLLQEVDMGVPRSRKMNLARELAKALGYNFFAIGLNVQLRQGYYGNATLSHFPILRKRNIDLTIGTHKRRGCQHTSIQIDNASTKQLLEIFNLHLGLSAQERVRQIGMLAQSIEFASLEDRMPCIVGGDFNDWRSLLPPVLTDILRFSCASTRQGRHQQGILSYPSFSPAGSLDKIFYRGGLKKVMSQSCTLPVARLASDHLPIIVDFEM